MVLRLSISIYLLIFRGVYSYCASAKGSKQSPTHACLENVRKCVHTHTHTSMHACIHTELSQTQTLAKKDTHCGKKHAAPAGLLKDTQSIHTHKHTHTQLQ